MSKKLTKREEDYSKWYNELVVKARFQRKMQEMMEEASKSCKSKYS